jgi:hypothetical protein
MSTIIWTRRISPPVEPRTEEEAMTAVDVRHIVDDIEAAPVSR